MGERAAAVDRLRPVDLARLRRELMVEGAPPDAFEVLRDSLDADLLISAAVEAGRSTTSPTAHPLAQVVHRRDLTNLVTWPFTGEVPARLAGLSRRTGRRGPVADRPVLGAEERDRFFDHLLVVADAYRSESDAVLRRQAIYLLGFDRRDETVRWLRSEQRAAARAVERCGSVPTWVSVRSSAVAIARTATAIRWSGSSRTAWSTSIRRSRTSTTGPIGLARSTGPVWTTAS